MIVKRPFPFPMEDDQSLHGKKREHLIVGISGEDAKKGACFDGGVYNMQICMWRNGLRVQSSYHLLNDELQSIVIEAGCKPRCWKRKSLLSSTNTLSYSVPEKILFIIASIWK